MRIHIGKNFESCEPVAIGAYPFSFTQDDFGRYTRKKDLRDIWIGDDVFINSFSIVEYGLYDETVLGDNCIIDGHVMIGHDVHLGKSVQVANGVHILGHVHIGDFSKIFAGATINPKVKIGRNCIVGAGSYVRHDMKDGSVAYGNPAKIITSKINYPVKSFP